MRDITERKKLEDQLRQRVDALAEADRQKNEFLAMLGHELRNPLGPMRNALYILKMARSDPKTQDEAEAMIERQLQHLVRLVDDLLDVSRIIRGRIELRRDRLDLALAVRRAVETAQPLIDGNGHVLDISLPERPVYVMGDLIRLSQVISNLLGNAAKYSTKPGRIRVVKQGRLLATPFLDITDRVTTGGESGLLSMAFAPDYARSGRFYVLYVANDDTPNFLWINRGDGTFDEVGETAGVALSEDGVPQAGMGTDMADFDGDGRLDLFVTNLSEEMNELYRNEGDGTFSNATFTSGVGPPSLLTLGFGTFFFDADQDGDLDLFVANGHIIDNIAEVDATESFAQPGHAFLNDGAGRFRDCQKRP